MRTYLVLELTPHQLCDPEYDGWCVYFHSHIRAPNWSAAEQKLVDLYAPYTRQQLFIAGERENDLQRP